MSFVDETFMKNCFELARKAEGRTSPNPMVGSVIVQDGQIISTGFHKKSGNDHGELDAIKNAGASIEGATLYCNLEPCCHTDKQTAPCAQRIIEEKISRVVISNIDPNPKVAGRAITMLRAAGIEVTTGVLEHEGSILNEVFFKNMNTQMPFVHIKVAQTLDGRIATNSGHSKWITNEKSRRSVHQMRAQYDAILVGGSTVRADDPSLTVRLSENTACPTRVIISKSGDLPLESKIFNDEFSYKTIVAIAESSLKSNAELAAKLESKSVHILPIAEDASGNISIPALLSELYRNGITSILVEGGQRITTSLIEKKLYDRISFFIAPKILGSGIDSVGDLGAQFVHESLELEDIEMKILENNFFISGKRSELCLQD